MLTTLWFLAFTISQPQNCMASSAVTQTETPPITCIISLAGSLELELELDPDEGWSNCMSPPCSLTGSDSSRRFCSEDLQLVVFLTGLQNDSRVWFGFQLPCVFHLVIHQVVSLSLVVVASSASNNASMRFANASERGAPSTDAQPLHCCVHPSVSAHVRQR